MREHELSALFIHVSFQLLCLRQTPPGLCPWTPLGTPVSLADPVLPPPHIPPVIELLKTPLNVGNNLPTGRFLFATCLDSTLVNNNYEYFPVTIDQQCSVDTIRSSGLKLVRAFEA